MTVDGALRSWQPDYRLGDGCSIKHGFAFEGKSMTVDGGEDLPVVVNIVNFQYTGGFRFDTTKVQRYVGSYPDEYRLKPGDVLLVMTCQTPKGEILGVPGRIPNDGRTYLHNQRLGLVQVHDEGTLDLRFLYYLFLTPRFNEHLFATSTGAKILHTAPSRMESYRFSRPPLLVQRKIAAVLSAYDDLIENNTRRIAILEEMARALYREWFVDFRFPGHEGMRMVESALGPVPEGWEIRPLSTVVALTRKGLNPSRSTDEEFEHFSIPAFDEGRMPVVEVGRAIKSTKYLVPDTGAVLLSKLNPRIPRVWLTVPSGTQRAIASTEFLVLEAKQPFTPGFLACLCQTPEFLGTFAGLAIGTSTSHQRAKPDDVLTLPTIIPPQHLVSDFSEHADTALRLAHMLRRKNANLRQTRDLLLPKLIVGEVDVSELEIARD